jgi:porin
MKQNYCKKLVAVAGVTLLIMTGRLAAGADAQTNAATSAIERFAEQDYLLGDWGGLRTDLSKHGIDFEFFYLGSVPMNLDGGIERGAIYQGALMMLLDLDSEKLAGYEGGTFHAGSLWINGQKPFSDKYVGDLNKVNLVDFPNGFRLWELWYEQKFFDGKLSLKAGQLSIDRDFIVSDYYNSLASVSFLNQTFFFPTMAFDVCDIAGLPPRNHSLAATPDAAPGARLRWDPVPQFYAQAGVYGGDADQTYSGTRFNLSQTEGALSYFEAGYRLNQQKTDTGLEGNYKLGGWFHTGSFDDVYSGVISASLAAAGSPAPPVREHPDNYGAYFLAEQQLFQQVGKEDPAKQGLVGFFRVAGAPADRNLAQFGVDGGLVYKGLVPSRNWDTLGIAVSYLEISDDIRKAQQDINALVGPGTVPVADFEGVIELSYKVQLTAWWTLQPSIQRVFHPGGQLQADIPDAWVFIIQTTLRF